MAFLLRSTRIVTPSGEISGALLVEGDNIAAVYTDEQIPSGFPCENLGSMAIMPGLVDPHVHINEPGRTEWEGFETATRAAAAGGITTLIDMPLNSSPVTTNLAALEEKIAAAAGQLFVDVGFHGGIVPGNLADLEPLIAAGVFGMKAFLVHSGIDEFPNATEVDLRAALPILSRHGIPLLVHAELAEPGAPPRVARFHADWSRSRPQSMEVRAIEMLLALQRESPCHLHIVHLAAGDAVPLLHAIRKTNKLLSVETCPHYLHFSDDDIAQDSTLFKCAPPIRDEFNRRALWSALLAGDIDTIASDHSPSTPDLKGLGTSDFLKAWGGISSLQFGLPIVWDHSERDGFTLCDVSRWMSTNPARIFGLDNRGAILPGYRADLLVFNPAGETVVDKSTTHHRHKFTPYEGERLRGRVVRTYLRGKLIHADGEFTARPPGSVLRRNSAHSSLPQR